MTSALTWEMRTTASLPFSSKLTRIHVSYSMSPTPCVNALNLLLKEVGRNIITARLPVQVYVVAVFKLVNMLLYHVSAVLSMLTHLVNH